MTVAGFHGWLAQACRHCGRVLGLRLRWFSWMNSPMLVAKTVNARRAWYLCVSTATYEATAEWGAKSAVKSQLFDWDILAGDYHLHGDSPFDNADQLRTNKHQRRENLQALLVIYHGQIVIGRCALRPRLWVFQGWPIDLIAGDKHCHDALKDHEVHDCIRCVCVCVYLLLASRPMPAWKKIFASTASSEERWRAGGSRVIARTAGLNCKTSM